jgi:hypothetical protein
MLSAMMLEIKKIIKNSIVNRTSGKNTEIVSCIPRRYGIKDKMISYTLYVLKIIIIIIYAPILLCFLLFESELFLKIVRQVIVISYSIFFIVFMYTLFNQNKKVFSSDEITIDIEYKDKIKSF